MILVSAGHYPNAQGARHGNITEYHETRAWADSLLDHLYARNMPCAFVPTGPLTHKVETINYIQPMLAVEIHFNADPNNAGRGCETLYCPGSEKGREAAEAVQQKLAAIFTPDRGVKEGWHRMDRPGVIDYHGDVHGDENINYFLRATACPAIIVEPEFLHNYRDILKHGRQACIAIAEALVDVLRHEYPGRTPWMEGATL